MKEMYKCTDLDGRRVATSRGKHWKKVSKEEFLVYSGLVLLADCEKRWDLSVRGLFGKEFSDPMHKATMPVERFGAF